MRLPRIHPLLAASTACFLLSAGALVWNPAVPTATLTSATQAQNSLTPDPLSMRAHLPYVPPKRVTRAKVTTAPRQQAQTIPVTASPPPSPAPTEPTPAQAAMGVLSAAQVEQLWVAEGGPASQEQVAACVVNAESGGNSAAAHVDSNGTVDTGLYQVNSVNAPSGEMMNPEANTAEAVHLFDAEGGWLPDWVADTAACGL